MKTVLWVIAILTVSSCCSSSYEELRSQELSRFYDQQSAWVLEKSK